MKIDENARKNYQVFIRFNENVNVKFFDKD